VDALIDEANFASDAYVGDGEDQPNWRDEGDPDDAIDDDDDPVPVPRSLLSEMLGFDLDNIDETKP